MEKKKKVLRGLLIGAVLVIAAGIYYYIALPAINIHSPGLWKFILFLIFVGTVLTTGMKTKKEYGDHRGLTINIDREILKELLKKARVGLILFAAVAIIYLIGSILSSPIVNAGRYQALMNVEEREFISDISEVDYSTIPLLDKDTAEIMGDRRLGAMVDMVSQFEVDTEYTQINYRGRPVRVTPLRYASLIKWFTNREGGIPAYLLIDMTTQEIEVVKLEQGIRYAKTEHFGRNLYRHLRFHYPTYLFDDQIFFEINEEGTPYWVCPVKQYNIGLFGGQTVGKVVLCNAITGECTSYNVEDVPEWVDKVYSAELLTGLYNYHGMLVHGFFNSVLGQRDCIRSTNGYNYIAMEDDVWVYTGVTSVNGDQSNVGFVLMNQRTMETRFYKVEGAIEDSAMSSAEGQVQHLGYRATFPLLVNLYAEPTYIIALKDDAGLVKKYAMVNVNRYQIVATGDTIRECESNYRVLLRTNAVIGESAGVETTSLTGTVLSLVPVVIDGNSHYYLSLEESELVFDIDLTNEELLGILRLREGDTITLTYHREDGFLVTVTELLRE